MFVTQKYLIHIIKRTFISVALLIVFYTMVTNKILYCILTMKESLSRFCKGGTEKGKVNSFPTTDVYTRDNYHCLIRID